MYNEVITLIAEDKTVDDYGDLIARQTRRTVFADLRSIGQSEFYQAQGVGLKPEIKFVLADFLEYRNEQKIEYTDFNGFTEIYTVLRTYRNNNELELVCRKGIE